MENIINQIIAAIEKVKDGYSSQYVPVSHNGAAWTIRVADHKANPTRIDSNMISFVVCESYPQGWCPDYQVYIDADGNDEQGMCLGWNVNYFLNK